MTEDRVETLDYVLDKVRALEAEVERLKGELHFAVQYAKANRHAIRYGVATLPDAGTGKDDL